MNGRKPNEPGSGTPWRLASMGTELAGAVLGGCALGWWVDRYFNTGHWGLIVGASIGIVGGLYNLVRKAVLESLGVSGRPLLRGKPPGEGGDETPSTRKDDQA